MGSSIVLQCESLKTGWRSEDLGRFLNGSASVQGSQLALRVSHIRMKTDRFVPTSPLLRRPPHVDNHMTRSAPW